jgi:hypothetical protein
MSDTPKTREQAEAEIRNEQVEECKLGKLADTLRDQLMTLQGDNWATRDVTLTMRLDDAYWLVNLAEEGIKARRLEFIKDAKNGEMGIGERLSLGEWFSDLKDCVRQIVEQASKPLPKKSRKTK